MFFPRGRFAGRLAGSGLREASLLQFIFLHQQAGILGSHQRGASLHEPEDQLVVAAARLGQLADDPLLETADGEPVLVDPRFRIFQVQAVHILLDVVPNGSDEVLALAPRRRAADLRIMRPHVFG